MAVKASASSVHTGQVSHGSVETKWRSQRLQRCLASWRRMAGSRSGDRVECFRGIEHARLADFQADAAADAAVDGEGQVPAVVVLADLHGAGGADAEAGFAGGAASLQADVHQRQRGTAARGGTARRPCACRRSAAVRASPARTTGRREWPSPPPAGLKAAWPRAPFRRCRARSGGGRAGDGWHGSRFRHRPARAPQPAWRPAMPRGRPHFPAHRRLPGSARAAPRPWRRGRIARSDGCRAVRPRCGAWPDRPAWRHRAHPGRAPRRRRPGPTARRRS